MSEWKEYKLGEVADIIPGFAFKSKDFGLKGENVVKIKDITPPCINIMNADKVDISEYNVNKLEKYILHEGDYVVAMTGATIGKVGKLKVNVKAYLNQRVAKIKAKEGVCDNFIYYTLCTDEFQSFIQNNIDSNSAQENISANSIARFPVLLPSISDQKHIASILSSLDDKIDLLHRENATLEVMAETLFRQWLIEEAKDHWNEMPLTKIANFTNGLACQKYPPKNDIDKLPVLKIRELANGISSDSDYATTELANEYIVHAGDVIFAWSASLMVKIWDGEDCILNQHLFKVTSDSFPKWFYYCWCKYHLNEFIAIAQSHATTMGHIKRGDLENTMVLVPSNDELKVMSDQFDCIIQKLENNNKEICTLIQTRDNLLPKLMNREIIIHG